MGNIAVTIACDDGYAIMERTIAPGRNRKSWKKYDYFFVAQCERVRFSLTSDSNVFEVQFERAQLKTFKGEGYWVEQSQTTSSTLNCEGQKVMHGLPEICGKVEYSGVEYRVIPTGMRNNRYCYEATGSSWRSITHTVFDDEVWWVVTDFASANPSAYSWITFEDEVIKAIRRAQARFSPTDATSILTFLRSRNTITHFWKESVKNSPASDVQGIICKDLNAVTPGQCQAACYYQSKQVAVSLTSDSRRRAGECLCADECNPAEGGKYFTFRLYRWFEGFFYNHEKSEVWILAHSDKENMVIDMWVEVADSCGNTATGKVEFWIAPSLEAAAAKGRTCDPPDSSPSVYVPPSFSGTEGPVGLDASLVSGISNAIDALNGLNDFDTTGNGEYDDEYQIAMAYASEKVLDFTVIDGTGPPIDLFHLSKPPMDDDDQLH